MVGSSEPFRSSKGIPLDSNAPASQPRNHRSGSVALVGRPNAGKSTLLNALLGQKLAIVTPKPQTTRRNLAGIYQEPGCQIAFLDTPGIHLPRDELSRFMLSQVESALEGADAAVFLLDAGIGVGDDERVARERLKGFRRPLLLALNKADLVPEKRREHLKTKLQEELGNHPVLFLEALSGKGIPELLSALKPLLPEGPPLYPEENLTDVPLRELAGELVREQCLLQLGQEVPYGVAVSVEAFEEHKDPVVMRAVLYVEKESQKGIVIGKGGRQLKNIGVQARREIEKLAERRVFLDLWVKVAEDWRRDKTQLGRLGYAETLGKKKHKRRQGRRR